MSYYEAYAKPLELLRKKHDYTKTYIAHHLGISVGTVSNHENARTIPELMTIMAYCKFYKISLAYFYHLVAYYQGISTSTKVDIDIRNDVALGMVIGV